MSDEKLEQLAKEYVEQVTPVLFKKLDDAGIVYSDDLLCEVAAASFESGYRARDAEVAKLRDALEQIAQPHGYNDYYSKEEMIETMDEDIEIAREALK
jgi:predicted O-methyltransferase YrrM